MGKDLFMTPHERLLIKRNEEICAFYLDMRNRNPKLSYNRLHMAIANKFGISTSQARKIIVDNIKQQDR